MEKKKTVAEILCSPEEGCVSSGKRKQGDKPSLYVRFERFSKGRRLDSERRRQTENKKQGWRRSERPPTIVFFLRV